MKPRLSIGVCVLISLVLVLVGLGYGTYGGFVNDRKLATDLLESDSGFKGVVAYRGADGLNLCVVAERHLTADSDVAALRQLSRKLSDGKDDMEKTTAWNQELDGLVSAVSQKLRQSPSFQQSTRDQRYLSMLENDFASLSKSSVIETYNSAAQDFNNSLTGTPMGKLAMLLGVKPCEIYE